MKKTVNFRLSNEAIYALIMLQQKFHTSKTSIVEEAIVAYAANKLSQDNPLLKFAGKLSTQEANSMLDTIKSHRGDKAIDSQL